MSMYNDIISGTTNIDKVHKVVVSLSGGLDSTTLLYLMVKKFGKENVFALSFNYNQRHDIELLQAVRTCAKLGVKHRVIDLSFLGDIVKDVSAMVKGDVATPTMKDILGDPQPVTYVPNRNMILASLTAAFAETVKADCISLGIQKIDSYAYWDTTPEFYDAIENVLKLNRKFPITFVAPFLSLSKVEEIQLGVELGVPYEDTWTCYNPRIEKEEKYVSEPAGGRNTFYRSCYYPCGTCPSCMERATAFKKTGIEDPVLKGVR